MTTPERAFNGADVLIRELINAGVDTIFCITGAGNLAIVDALFRDGSIKIIYSHHEQAAVMEAQGYSRVSGKLGVALVTTGGGTSNIVTGVLSAHLDSIPVLVISGNESSFHCSNPSGLRAYGVQGFDSVAVMHPITKVSMRVKSVEEVASTFQALITSAMEDRKGCVLMDFPMDLQRSPAREAVRILQSAALGAGKEVEKLIATGVTELVKQLSLAHQPLLYIGNGCRDSKTSKKLLEFIEKNRIPYALSWSALDLFPTGHELNVGRIGIYGDRSTNILLQKTDLLICIGTRLAIPQVGYDKSDFGRNAIKWVVDIDPTECSKFDGLGWNILPVAAEDFIDSLTEFIDPNTLNADSIDSWNSSIQEIKSALPRIAQVGPMPKDGFIHSAQVMAELNSCLKDDAIIATDVGAGLLTGHYMLSAKGSQRIFTSQGLGEMGFGLPGAIGAYFAAPKHQIICLNTDGAIMFNLQELQVVLENKIPLKLFIFNNDGYSMIKISQENLFDGRIAGSTTSSGISFPNFKALATAFNFSHITVSSENDFDMMHNVLSDNTAVIIEVIMSPDQKYLPRLSTSKAANGTLISPPLEDLDPLLPIDELEKYLGYKAHRNSYSARGLEYVEA